MKQIFELRNGTIVFEDDKISISDKAKNQKYLTIFSSIIWILLGIRNVYKFEQSIADNFDYIWIVLGVLYIVILVITLLRSTKNTILMDEVQSIKLKQRLNNQFLDIKLKNNRLRRVSQIDEPEELEEYIKTYFDGRWKE